MGDFPPWRTRAPSFFFSHHEMRNSLHPFTTWQVSSPMKEKKKKLFFSFWGLPTKQCLKNFSSLSHFWRKLAQLFWKDGKGKHTFLLYLFPYYHHIDPPQPNLLSTFLHPQPRLHTPFSTTLPITLQSNINNHLSSFLPLPSQPWLPPQKLELRLRLLQQLINSKSYFLHPPSNNELHHDLYPFPLTDPPPNLSISPLLTIKTPQPPNSKQISVSGRLYFRNSGKFVTNHILLRRLFSNTGQQRLKPLCFSTLNITLLLKSEHGLNPFQFHSHLR